MSWSIKKLDDGTYEYECFQSSYGLVGGYAASLAEAKVLLAINEASLLEQPYPPSVIKAMMSNPEKYEKDFPDPLELIECNHCDCWEDGFLLLLRR